MYPDSKAERICEENGSVHGVNRTVPDVEQCSCVVKAQVAARGDNRNTLNQSFLVEYLFCTFECRKVATLHLLISA